MKKWFDYPIKVVKIGDKDYPTLLTKLKKPPKKLYYRGQLSGGVLKKTLAIVGSRMMTRYGREVVDRFVSMLTTQRVTTISGFMYGVDTEVHLKTIEYGGVTMAVFGCGLDVVYPPENENLYSRILRTGGVVFSEYKPQAKPHLWKFPQRNRIIVGLASLGVLVVEGAKGSGSLVTARIAREEGKKIYAVPGPITSSVSTGTNWLIKEGRAMMVIDTNDLLGKKISIRQQRGQMPTGLSSFEKKIWQALSRESLNTDEVAAQVNKDVIEVSKALSLMSLRGLITESAGKFYVVDACSPAKS
jgi:DNA processing protein